MNAYEEITLELARMERQMLAAVRAKIAAQQCGEAWVDLIHPEAQTHAGDMAASQTTG